VWEVGGGERMAEDDKDHTISSSSLSESESLAHLVLGGEVSDSMSSDEEGDEEVMEVDMMMCY
jgi:hypothetical protein